MAALRLASGLRINRAGDDAAGLSIAAGLATDARVHAQGVRNLGDAVSYLSIAESAASELKGVLFRLRELATQSANGTLGTADRQPLEEEARNLIEEYNRIVGSTSFNGRNLFTSSEPDLSVQIGYGLGGRLVTSISYSRSESGGDGTAGLL